MAALAFDRVAAVAGVPHERVVAAAHEGHVAASAAVDHIVAIAAQQDVVAVAAGDRVIAGAAVHGERDQRSQTIAGREGVVAAVHIDDQTLSRADVEAEGGRVDAVETDAGAVGSRREFFGAIAAVDHDGVNAVAPLVQIRALAGVPDHEVVSCLAKNLIRSRAAGQHIVAIATEQQVVAAFAEQRVISRLAKELVVAAAAGERVVAITAKDVRLWQCAVGFVQSQVVVAAQPEDLDELGVRDRGLPSQDWYSAAVDKERPGCITRDHEVVGLRVADDRQNALCGGKCG